ncbi:MAG: hypothetical protein Q4A28_05580 [Brachymonas sp.]|nr:hypothetical protein [Brachymonas sp.]
MGIKTLLMAAAAVGASQVWAHDIQASCRGKAQIRCQGQFSDGSSLAGANVRVLSYEDVVQWTGKVDAKGQVVFKRPAGKFYVQFIAADGHLGEVDHEKIKP